MGNSGQNSTTDDAWRDTYNGSLRRAEKLYLMWLFFFVVEEEITNIPEVFLFIRGIDTQYFFFFLFFFVLATLFLLLSSL